MKGFKGYVFRLYPTKDQEILINKTIGCSRFIYNHFLADKIEEYKETGKSKSANIMFEGLKIYMKGLEQS